MRIVVDTGVFSAAISPRRRKGSEEQVQKLAGSQLFLAAASVAELRYGSLVAGWGEPRRAALERAISATTVVPISDGLLTTLAALRFECRKNGLALADPVHSNDLWIGASAVHLDIPLVTADKVFAGVPGRSGDSKKRTKAALRI